MKAKITKRLTRIGGGLLVVTGLLLLAGCFTLSVHPFYLKADVVWEPDLLGVWGDPEDQNGESWQFLAGTGETYQLVIREGNSLRIDPDQDGVFKVHLFRLGSHLYLDLFPEEPEAGSDFYKGHVVPAHSVWQVDISGNALTMKIFESSRMQEALDEGRLKMDYVNRDGIQVLTGSTEALQQMLRDHSVDFFGEGETLQRIQ